MILFISTPKAQKRIAKNVRSRRLANGLTQEGLAKRAGVTLPTLRKFEQKGLISLESFLKLSMALDFLDDLVKATELPEKAFASIDEVLKSETDKKPKRGWRK